MSSLTAPSRRASPLPSALRLDPWATGLVVACLALGALSLMTPSVPTTDPWGWIVWGREVAHLDLDTSSGGSPSWKPLPVLLTTPLSVFGDALPELWLVAARAGGLIGLVLAVVLARRLLGRPGRSVAVAAGGVAVLALALSTGWLRSLLHGYSEPLVLALLFGAVLAHAGGRRTLPLVLLVLGGLARPELWAVIGLYGIWLWRSGALSFAKTLLLLLPIPVLWFGGDLWGAGDALHGSSEAASIAGLRKISLGEMLSETFGGGMLAVPVLALVGVALRPRDRTLRVLAGACAGYIGYLCLLVALGYPSTSRFLELPVGVLCVLAGVGAGAALQTVLERRRPADRSHKATVAAVLAGVGVALLGVTRGPTVPNTVSGAHERAVLQLDLRDTVAALGRESLVRCGDPILPADLHWNEAAVAFTIHDHLSSVRRVLPWNALDGELDRPAVMLAPLAAPPEPKPWLARAEPIGRSGRWGLYRISPSTAATPPPCRV
ncbi:MAG: hypothetical protein M3350_10645 [Actinomycetota bacterium]|nr:hypothetical protein [Actinomycetota bacterium]MDQ3721218.1 hypothetical protein [Actinomycetota bacterium]